MKQRLLMRSRTQGLFMQSPQHAVAETSQYVAAISFIGTRTLIRIRWVYWHVSFAYPPLICFLLLFALLSLGSGVAVRLTSISASDSRESFWTCERLKAMLGARWTCTTIKRDERWDLAHGKSEKRRLMIALLSSLKPDFIPWEPWSFCFHSLTNVSRFVRKRFLRSPYAFLKQIYLYIVFYIVLPLSFSSSQFYFILLPFPITTFLSARVGNIFRAVVCLFGFSLSSFN